MTQCRLAKLGRRSRHDRVKSGSPGTHDAPPPPPFPPRAPPRPAGPGRSPLDVLFTALFARNNTANRYGIPGCRTCRSCIRYFGICGRAPRMAAARSCLTGHINITRHLCTLSGPTNRSITDAKMVTECAKCVPAPRDAPAHAMFALFCPPAHESGRRAASRAASGPQGSRERCAGTPFARRAKDVLSQVQPRTTYPRHDRAAKHG